MIEVEIKSQTETKRGRERVWYRTEYGQCFERRHGSTSEREELDGLLSSYSRLVVSSMRCHRCREEGHKAMDCHLPKTDLSCYKCGETGHRAVDCVSAHKVGLATLLTSNILIPEVR